MSTISSVSSGVTQPPDFSQMEQALFNKADADGDGSINQDELQGLMTNNPRLAKAFSSLAANSNGSTATAADVLKKLDTDGDGKVSATEFTAGLQQARATIKSHGHGHHHAAPPPPDDNNSTDGTSSTSDATDLKTLLEQLLSKIQKDGSTTNGTSGDASSTGAVSGAAPTDSTSSSDKDIKALLTQILEKLKQQSGYSPDGTPSTTSATSAAIFQVTA